MLSFAHGFELLARLMLHRLCAGICEPGHIRNPQLWVKSLTGAPVPPNGYRKPRHAYVILMSFARHTRSSLSVIPIRVASLGSRVGHFSLIRFERLAAGGNGRGETGAKMDGR